MIKSIQVICLCLMLNQAWAGSTRSVLQIENPHINIIEEKDFGKLHTQLSTMLGSYGKYYPNMQRLTLVALIHGIQDFTSENINKILKEKNRPLATEIPSHTEKFQYYVDIDFQTKTIDFKYPKEKQDLCFVNAFVKINDNFRLIQDHFGSDMELKNAPTITEDSYFTLSNNIYIKIVNQCTLAYWNNRLGTNYMSYTGFIEAMINSTIEDTVAANPTRKDDKVFIQNKIQEKLDEYKINLRDLQIKLK